mgnify:CR=1 FL=1
MTNLTLLLLASAAMTGCISKPIKTNFEVIRPDGLGLSYSSEKDVMYEKQITDADGTIELIRFNAISSAAALAQAERDSVQAQANASNAQAVVSALSLLP